MQNLIDRQADRLLVPQRVNARKLLAALAMVESAGGRNLQPNFEPAFWKEGKYWNAHLAGLAGDWSHHADPVMAPFIERCVACSWGPWQILYVTAEELGYWGPPWALVSPELSLTWGIRLINKRIIPKLTMNAPEQQLVSEIADGYNSGNPRDNLVPTNYINLVLTHYNNPNVGAELADLGKFGNFG